MIDKKLDWLTNMSCAKNTAVTSGHMFRGGELDSKEQAVIEAKIRVRADELLAKNGVGIVYGALACGSDIVLAEAALSHGAQFEAVLPFAKERFVETSVRIGDPPGQPGKWEQRFHSILDGAHGPCSLTVMEPSDPPRHHVDDFFFYCFRYAAGCALQRAAILASDCRLVAVSDASDADSVAGTNAVLADWHSHGRPFDLIPFPRERSARESHSPHDTRFKPVVFIWNVAPQASALLRQLLSEPVGSRLGAIEYTDAGIRCGISLVFNVTSDAIDTARSIVEVARQEKDRLRVVCDFGFVVGADLKPRKELVDRLQAAANVPFSPLNEVLATEAFVAQSKYDHGDDVAFEQAQNSEFSSAAESDPCAPVHSRLSTPMYALLPPRPRSSKP